MVGGSRSSYTGSNPSPKPGQYAGVSVAVAAAGVELGWGSVVAVNWPGVTRSSSKSRSPKVAATGAPATTAVLLVVRNISELTVVPADQKTCQMYRCHDPESAGSAIITDDVGAVFHAPAMNTPTLLPEARARKLIVYHWPATKT